MSVRALGGAAGQAIGSWSVAPDTVRVLGDLLSDLPNVQIRGDAGVSVSGVCYRSGDAGPGALFFCVPGSATDGHAFAADAVERGAVALVVERRLEVDAACAGH